MIRHMITYLMLFAAVAIIAACRPEQPTNTPIPNPSEAISAPAVVTEIVTITPLPRDTPTVVPTPEFDTSEFLGTWQLTLTYHLNNHPPFDSVRFSGITTVNVDESGGLTGDLALYTSAEQNAPCTVTVLDEAPLKASISGRLRKANDGKIVADLALNPADPNRASQLGLSCPNLQTLKQYTEPLLWPALTAAKVLRMSVPVSEFYSGSTSVDLPGKQGKLTLEVQFGR